MNRLAILAAALALPALLAGCAENGYRMTNAAQYGDVGALQAALLSGISVNERNGKQETALHSAAFEGQMDAMQLLLKVGADVDAKTGNQATPLDYAAAGGHAEAVRLLLEHGASVDEAADGGFTPLLFAARQGDLATAKVLLEHGADPLATSYGMTAADIAEKNGHGTLAAMLRAAIDKGVAAPDVSRPAAPPPEPVAQAADSDVDSPGYRHPAHPDDWALVIGIESYHKNLPKADYAERDADAVRRHLIALGFPEENVITLKGQDATQSGIASYLEEYLPKNVTANSRVFFYYSGHGAPDPDSGTAYLVPWEADPQFIKKQGLPLSRIYADLKSLHAKQTLVALDSCFSGAGGRSVLQRGARPLVNVKLGAADAGPGATVLAASQADQITLSIDGQRHGLFTYYLLKGLQSGAQDSKALYDFVKPQVDRAARRQNSIQVPTYAGSDFSF
ncbi:MAG TPA: ankyrin repeat domain-containing protein [Elusimicrobiota bacterium]|nr:ankyrin repeat domain-containing protein [Elusimicrobiota bacterium]